MPVPIVEYRVKCSIDQSFRTVFCVPRKDLQPVSHDVHVVVTGDRMNTRATAHLRLLRRGKASLLSLQREFLNDVWGGLPLLALFPTSSLRTPSLSVSLSFSLFLSLLSVPLGALTLSSSRVSFPRFTRQLQSTSPPTGSLLGVYISGVFIRDWTFFVLVAGESLVLAVKEAAGRRTPVWCARRVIRKATVKSHTTSSG